MNIKRFAQLKKENRAGYLKCIKCKTLKYFSVKQIQNLNKIICTECLNKKKRIIKLKLKPKPESIPKPIYTKQWITMTPDEKRLALKLIRSGSTYKQISEILQIEAKQLYNVRYLENKDNQTIETILNNKIRQFSKGNTGPQLFTIHELLAKIGPNPKCYLTGDDIDLTKKDSYQLDHIIPRSKGGPNTLDNCGLTTKQANMVKTNLQLDELVSICKKIITICST